MSQRLATLAALLWIVPAAALAAPPASGPCATPRSAVQVLLDWQQPDHTDRDKAAACLELPAGTAPKVARTRARQIKDVLDGRGLFVKVSQIPDTPGYTAKDGRARVVLFPRRLPEFYLRKVGGRWLWSAETVAAAPKLHRKVFALDLRSLQDHLPGWARGEVMGLQAWQLLGILIVLLLGLVVRLLVMLLVASQARRLMGRLGAKWGEEILARVDTPLGTLAAAGTIAVLLPGLHLPVRLVEVALLALRVVAAFSVVWVAYRLVDVVTGWLDHKAAITETKLDDQLVPLVRTALKIFIVALGVVFVLQNLDVDVGSLLAGLGLGGLAFALAARDTVANLFGAVTIFLDRPFQIGDWVVVSGVEGIVEKVGFRSTRLRTFYNSLVAVPNHVVAGASVDNYGKREYRRTVVTLSVTYSTTPEQMQAFVEGIRAIVQANPYTRKDYYEVHFSGFGESGLSVMVYFFFKVPSWSDELREKHHVFLEILRLAHDLGVRFAFPTRTLEVERLAEAAPAPAPSVPGDLAAVVEGYGPGGGRSRPGGPKLTSGYFAATEPAGSTRGETTADDD